MVGTSVSSGTTTFPLGKEGKGKKSKSEVQRTFKNYPKMCLMYIKHTVAEPSVLTYNAKHIKGLSCISLLVNPIGKTTLKVFRN